VKRFCTSYSIEKNEPAKKGRTKPPPGPVGGKGIGPDRKGKETGMESAAEGGKNIKKDRFKPFFRHLHRELW